MVYNGEAVIRSVVLLVDAVINLILGVLLLFLSGGIIQFLGIPPAESFFYPNILGGVLFGIGLALLLEYFRRPQGLRGLGLGGAVTINLCGGFVLAGWLVLGNLNLPAHGRIILWILVVVLIGLSGSELAVYSRAKQISPPENG
jgi:hypothetical protein